MGYANGCKKNYAICTKNGKKICEKYKKLKKNEKKLLQNLCNRSILFMQTIA